MSKPLQIIGILALLAWTGLGLFAWVEIKGHFSVAIEENSGEQSDESALLADRIASLSEDLDNLVDALKQNFSLVAQAIESDSNDQAVRSALVEQRLASVEQSLPLALQARETAGALSTALSQVQALMSMVVENPNQVEAEQPQQAAEVATPTPTVAVAPIENPLPIPDAVSDAPMKRSFLAFNLPSRDFQFEGRQRFEILTDLSRVGFDAKSTLHDFSGVSNLVSGTFSVDLAKPEKGITGSVSVQTDSLSTGLDGRDEAMLEHLDSKDYPTLNYSFEGFEVTTLDIESQKLTGIVTGKMSINGTTKTLKMPVRAHVDESRRLIIEGEAPLSRADYNVDVPSKLGGTISTEDEVKIWINLRARARRGA